jgi:hypothetical protein
MSLAIAYHGGHFGCVVSDCQQTHYTKGYKDIVSTEQVSKLHQIAPSVYGFVTGVGDAPLITTVEERLYTTPPQSREDVLTAILDARAEAWNRHDVQASDSVLDQVFSRTAFLFLVAGAEGVSLSSYHPTNEHDLKTYQHGEFTFLFPMEDGPFSPPPARMAQMRDALLARLGACYEQHGAAVSDYAVASAAVLRSVLVEYARDLKSVSVECQVGIVFDSGELYLSGVLTPDAPLSFESI